MTTEAPGDVVRVVITGASSEIGQTLSYYVARGDVFGPKQRIFLVLVENSAKLKQLKKGTSLELGMCSLRLIHGQLCTQSLDEAFRDADVIFLVSGLQPSPGLSRNDLIGVNALEYKEVGLSLERVAKPTVKIVVVAEPQNSNLIAMSYHAPTLTPQNMTALSRVDHNRAQTMLARMLNISCDKVRHLTMWGNRSTSIFPDIRHARIEVMGKEVPAYDAIKDDFFLKYKFTETLQGREAEILKKRKATCTAMTIATAAAQHMRDWVRGTKPNDWTSMVVLSDGSYGIEKGLAYSFPVKVSKTGQWEIVQDLDINYYEREKLDEQAEFIKAERMFAYSILDVPEARKERDEEVEGDGSDHAKATFWSFGHADPIPCSILGPIEQERLGNM
ncbi:hypothetical protein BsWGS_08213 [Bradybaena similaris]